MESFLSPIFFSFVFLKTHGPDKKKSVYTVLYNLLKFHSWKSLRASWAHRRTRPSTSSVSRGRIASQMPRTHLVISLNNQSINIIVSQMPRTHLVIFLINQSINRKASQMPRTNPKSIHLLCMGK